MPAIVCVPVGLAVTVPAIVTVLPIVTEEIDTGWVSGKFEMETAEKVTACDAGKLLTVTVPVMAAPTVTVTFSSALRLLLSSATVTVLATVTVDANAPDTTGADSVTTVGVSVICR